MDLFFLTVYESKGGWVSSIYIPLDMLFSFKNELKLLLLKIVAVK